MREATACSETRRRDGGKPLRVGRGGASRRQSAVLECGRDLSKVSGTATPSHPTEARPRRLNPSQAVRKAWKARAGTGAGVDAAPAGRSMGLEPGRGGAQGGCGPGWGSGGAAEDHRGAEHEDGRGPTVHAARWTQAHAGLSSAAGAGSSYRGWGRGASAVGIKSLSVCKDQAFRIGMSFTTGRHKRGPTSPRSSAPDTYGEDGVG